MSQRSHIAYSGSRAISACSAACREPGAACSSVSCKPGQGVVERGCGTASQNAWVVKVCSGRSRVVVSSDVAVRHVAALVGDDLFRDLQVAGEQGGAGQLARVGLSGDQHVLVGLGLRVVAAVEVVDHDRARLEVEVLDEVAAPQVQVDGAGVTEAEDALALHRADDLALPPLDDGELLVACGAQPDRGGDYGRAQTRPSLRRRSRPPCASRSACSRPCSPKKASSSAVSGRS